MAHSVLYYGLLPQSSDKMENLAPTILLATEYITTRDSVSKEDSKTIYNKLTKDCDLGLATHTGCLLPKALFQSTGQTISPWLTFRIHYMYLLHVNVHIMNSIPLFKKGYYCNPR